MTQSSNESHDEPEHATPPRPDAAPPAQPESAPPAPPAPQSAPAAAQVPLPVSGTGLKVPAGLNPAAWWTGAAAGVGAYVALLLVSVVVTLLSVVGLAASGSGDSLTVPDNPFVADGDLPSPWSVLFQFAAQLPVLGMLGSLGGKLHADLGTLGAIDFSGGIFAIPLLITVVGIAALFIGSRIGESRRPSATTLDRIMVSVVCGAAFSLLLNLVATIASIRISASMGIALNLNAANFASIAVAFLIGATASFLGRNTLRAVVPGSSKRGFVVSLIRDAGLTVTAHLAVFLVVAIPVVVIVLGVKSGWAATLSAPLWAPTVGLLLLGLGHFAAVGTVSAIGMGSGPALGESKFGYGVTGTLAELGLPIWAGWLLVLLALLAVTAAATYWYLRRGAKNPKSILGWTALPVSFFIAGALLLWLSGIHASFTVGGAGGGSVSIGLAWWTPFLMLLWGVVAEVASRYLAPMVVPVLPAKLLIRIQKSPSAPSFSHTESSGLAATGGPAVPAFGPIPANTPPPPAGDPAQGASGAQAAPGTFGTTVPVEHTPLSKKAKRNLAIIGGAVGLVIILIGGGAIAVSTVRGANGPDKVVQDYLGALVDGNAERALEISDPNVPNPRRALMTNEIYGKATNRPDGFTVLKTTVSGDSATVAVELRQNGAKSEVSYRVAKIAPTFLDNKWTMRSIEAKSLSASSDSELSTVLVNGVEVSGVGLDQGSKTYFSLPALPGTYEISLPVTSKFISSEPVTATVHVGDVGISDSARLSAEPNKAFNTAVQEQVSAKLKTCAEQKTLKPENCPFATYEYSDTRNITWKITKEPTFDIYSSDTNTWRLITKTPGEAVASYERDKSYGSKEPQWEAKTENSVIYLQGAVTINKDELSVEFSH